MLHNHFGVPNVSKTEVKQKYNTTVISFINVNIEVLCIQKCTVFAYEVLSISHLHMVQSKAKRKAFWLPLSGHAYPVTSAGAPVHNSGIVSQHWQVLLVQNKRPAEGLLAFPVDTSSYYTAG